MRKTMAILLATGLFNAMPALAEHRKDAMPVVQETTATQNQKAADCARECDLLLKDCALQVDSIQERIQKIKAAIEANGAKPENAEELRVLNKKLKEVNETLRSLNKPGH